ncbi:hypothetical protein J5N97_025083 [Dioscorea zingiberensis]|uniref:Uncharacterized protein n=1 Tax=Dioscorea zingiberensis TaxID=325984 RepID=A0A9D5C7V2_9LILI|nr:hypothetical protein J5N97_025083 [Dioscorea zingiberensis]
MNGAARRSKSLHISARRSLYAASAELFAALRLLNAGSFEIECKKEAVMDNTVAVNPPSSTFSSADAEHNAEQAASDLPNRIIARDLYREMC